MCRAFFLLMRCLFLEFDKFVMCESVLRTDVKFIFDRNLHSSERDDLPRATKIRQLSFLIFRYQNTSIFRN